MSDILKPKPSDEHQPEVRALLENLQGNIVKGHGRDFSMHLFFRFGGDKTAVRRGLKALAAKYVGSAWQQLQDVDDYKQFGVTGPLFGNLVISADGYRFLELPLPESRGDDTTRPPETSFRHGMKQYTECELNDPPFYNWEKPYRGEVHAMLLLADDDLFYLMRQTREAMQLIRQHSELLTVERGQAVRNQRGETVEHFGYVDGRSQPLFLKRDFIYENGKPVADDRGHPIANWNPVAPLKYILVPDNPIAQPHCFGSFLVFRKLEQNVREFVRNERALAQRLFGDATPANQDRAGALVVGRFRDGSPAALSGSPGYQPPEANDFVHATNGHPATDPKGHCCPLQGHIRKANPRGETPIGHGTETTRRVVRRGITYGGRSCDAYTPNLQDLPDSGVGLLFMCFQASIKMQFAFIQKNWCNADSFRSEGTGRDALIGQSESTVVHKWSSVHGEPANQSFSFGQYVTLKGGEFFFAPSLPFFQSLA